MIPRWTLVMLPLILLLNDRQRKKIAHSLLLSEVLGQLAANFRPQVSAIKTQVEVLIQKEYIERIEVDGQPGYNYLA